MKFKSPKKDSNVKIICIGRESKAKKGDHIVPEIGKTYFAYDDGKIRYSREFQVKITKSFNLDTDDLLTLTTEDGESLIDIIEDEVINHDWLYSSEQNVIYYGECTDEKYKDMSQWFLKTVDGEWFGINNYCDALLDLTGYYYKLCREED